MYNFIIKKINKLKGLIIKIIKNIFNFFKKRISIGQVIVITLIVSLIFNLLLYFVFIKPLKNYPNNFHNPTNSIPHLVDKDGEDKDLLIKLMNSKIINLPKPTEEFLHRSDYKELPEEVWNGNHKDELWYLSEIWQPNDDRYDFQIKNFYLEKLKAIFENETFKNLIYPYKLEIKGELINSFKDRNSEKTNIKLEIENRSVYGLNIKSINFKIHAEILNRYTETDLTLKFPKAIEVKKEIFTDFLSIAFLPEFPPYFETNLSGKNTFDGQNVKHSILDIRNKGLGHISSFHNQEINKKFLKHAKKYHSPNFPDPKPEGINMDYIFQFNFHDNQPNKEKQYSYGFYLITQIHCDHNKNNGEANPYRENGKWIR